MIRMIAPAEFAEAARSVLRCLRPKAILTRRAFGSTISRNSRSRLGLTSARRSSLSRDQPKRAHAVRMDSIRSK